MRWERQKRIPRVLGRIDNRWEAVTIIGQCTKKPPPPTIVPMNLEAAAKMNCTAQLNYL